MTDEAHHIARQAAALDDPRLCRDSGSVTDAQDEAPERIWLKPGLIRQAGGYPATLTFPDHPKAIEYVRAALARPSQAGDERVAEAAQRVAHYLGRRKKSRSDDPDFIHGYDVSPEGEFVLSASDLAVLVSALSAAPQPPMRDETGMEHIARDMREGRFPDRSPRQQVPVAAAPQPAPMDREALVEVIVDASGRTMADNVVIGGAGEIADALLARGLRLPGGNETMAWAVVGDDGKPEPHLVSALKQKAEQWVLPGRHLVRVAIRVVEGGDDA